MFPIENQTKSYFSHTLNLKKSTVPINTSNNSTEILEKLLVQIWGKCRIQGKIKLVGIKLFGKVEKIVWQCFTSNHDYLIDKTFFPHSYNKLMEKVVALIYLV